MMRTRSITGLAALALLTVYGALPCLVAASAASHPMDSGAPMAPCGAADAPSATLLCATPTAYTPLSCAPSVPTPPVLAAPTAAVELIAATIVTTAPAPRHDAPAGRARPVFLLHASLLN